VIFLRLVRNKYFICRNKRPTVLRLIHLRAIHIPGLPKTDTI
jgi:hypothetical protein